MGKWFFHSHQVRYSISKRRPFCDGDIIFHNKSLSLRSEHQLESNCARNFKGPASYSFWSHLALRRRGFHQNKLRWFFEKRFHEYFSEFNVGLKMYDWAFYVLKFTTADDCSLSSFHFLTKSWDIIDLLSTPLAYARISLVYWYSNLKTSYL
jgi:hypothetical protein